MNKMSAAETLKYLIELFTYYLENLYEDNNSECKQFISGEKTAYVECLEIIQYWEHAKINGLDFDIEARFPL